MLKMMWLLRFRQSIIGQNKKMNNMQIHNLLKDTKRLLNGQNKKESIGAKEMTGYLIKSFKTLKIIKNPQNRLNSLKLQ